MTSTLDFLTDAVHRYLREGESGIAWVFHFRMTDADRLRFDGFLVAMQDELAWQAGTCESRFRTRVMRMAELYRQAKAERDAKAAA
jgi:hypothetical protein